MENDMRRKDRAVTEKNEILEIMKKCTVCRIALTDGEYPYIIPLNFGVYEKEGNVFLYFHGAKEGKKLDCVEKNPKAAFEMDCENRIAGGENACSYTMFYESVCGTGTLETVTGEEKVTGLQSIMKQVTGKAEWSFGEKEIEAVTVLRLTVDRMTGKKHV